MGTTPKIAGPERATAATKTYTTELLAAALLSTALDPPSAQESIDLAGLPALMSAALTAEPHARDLAAAHADRQRAVVLGRGYSYPSAREWALKLQEMALVAAMAYSAADFEHGPLALLEPGVPVLATIRPGPTFVSLVALVDRLRTELAADVAVVSDADDALALARWPFRVPAGTPEWLGPIVSIVVGQLHALHLTHARGLDPEAPRNLNKVTRTR
jgi:glucosamine--fructose-6-phosphate aminotransferase (isomerizing)